MRVAVYRKQAKLTQWEKGQGNHEIKVFPSSTQGELEMKDPRVGTDGDPGKVRKLSLDKKKTKGKSRIHARAAKKPQDEQLKPLTLSVPLRTKEAEMKEGGGTWACGRACMYSRTKSGRKECRKDGVISRWGGQTKEETERREGGFVKTEKLGAVMLGNDLKRALLGGGRGLNFVCLIRGAKKKRARASIALLKSRGERQPEDAEKGLPDSKSSISWVATRSGPGDSCPHRTTGNRTSP